MPGFIAYLLPLQCPMRRDPGGRDIGHKEKPRNESRAFYYIQPAANISQQSQVIKITIAKDTTPAAISFVFSLMVTASYLYFFARSDKTTTGNSKKKIKIYILFPSFTLPK